MTMNDRVQKSKLLEAENETDTHLHKVALRREPDAPAENAANLKMAKNVNVKSRNKRLQQNELERDFKEN